ncbi:MAG: hypothetical protein H0X45_05035 [Planctomycetes bacterium]|nr:hypothetical protein [Planctomycetota bacterium]
MPSLSEVIGHDGPRRLLQRLVARGRLPHALLIDGMPGSGRRTLSRGLAGALLCASMVDGDACGTCQSCIMVAAGTHPDLVELPHDGDAASDPSVDLVRDQVVAAARESPLIGPRRVFVLYGVERLRGAAANALLKVLEEPPAGTHLVMTTAAAAGVLATIRSRAQLLRLQPLGVAELERVLIRGGIAPGLAAARARSGGGSHRGLWRDAEDPAPISALRRLLEQGIDSGTVADAVAHLPSREPRNEDGVERTLAAEQRLVCRRWLEQVLQSLRADLRGADAVRAADRIERVLAAIRDLQRNLQPRLVIESLGLSLRN